jgi:hypothetical protein
MGTEDRYAKFAKKCSDDVASKLKSIDQRLLNIDALLHAMASELAAARVARSKPRRKVLTHDDQQELDL